MARLCVLELLQREGKTKYWLYKRMGMSYQNFNKMVNNETTAIHYDKIEKMCRILNCTPDDIFEIKSNNE